MICNYLAFEGIDGSGKSSLIRSLSEILTSQNIDNKIVREPGGTKVGEGIRELLLSHEYDVDALTEALLFCSQRSQLVTEIIKPEINKGTKILSDRSAYSSVAYQGVGRGLGYETIYQLNDIAVNSYWPEKVVLLDIDPTISLSRQRVADRIGSDKVDFFKKVREGYLRLAEEFENNFLIINAEEDLSDNLQKICMWLKVENSK
ncbi:dTMP kinase [Acidimicrobiaceae bacterium]|nr:dTMP kinase [Acidimicrobiaceae bacterium]|tara:strand:- start:115 stop:726 length:612 start_codon:yes stop_codon:yes gene_type:complete